MRVPQSSPDGTWPRRWLEDGTLAAGGGLALPDKATVDVSVSVDEVVLI